MKPSIRLAVLFVVVAVFSTSCYFSTAVYTNKASDGAEMPWWCDTNQDQDACRFLSAYIDLALQDANVYPTLADAVGAGATIEPFALPTGVGTAYHAPGVGYDFEPGVPNAFLYAGPAGTDRLVGVAYVVKNASATPPEGFPGSRDQWTLVDPADGTWFLPVWVVAGYENHPDLFASTHPCLAAGVTLTATTDACYVASHTDPLEILVTNDDGIGAPGIDALVQGLSAIGGVNVTVVAPATNQSGTGDSTTPGGATGGSGTTASGFVGTAVNGTPADSVNYALDVLEEVPDLVMSGINEGQNVGFFTTISGTVGAARTAARRLYPAVATSQAVASGFPTDFPAGVTATLTWLEEYRLGVLVHPEMEVPNINTPTCTAGSVRGTAYTTVAPDFDGWNVQDCTSTETQVNDDIDALNFGFVGIADVGLE